MPIVRQLMLFAVVVRQMNVDNILPDLIIKVEAIGVARALSGHRPPLMSLKGAIGHSLGAAGAVEAVATLGALQRGEAPPTVGARRIDPEIDADVVLDTPRVLRGDIGLSTSSGFGGINAAVVLQSSSKP